MLILLKDVGCKKNLDEIKWLDIESEPLNTWSFTHRITFWDEDEKSFAIKWLATLDLLTIVLFW